MKVLLIAVVLMAAAFAAGWVLAGRDAELERGDQAVSRCCITCGQPTRRRWCGQPVCYGCAGVSVIGGAR